MTPPVRKTSSPRSGTEGLGTGGGPLAAAVAFGIGGSYQTSAPPSEAAVLLLFGLRLGDRRLGFSGLARAIGLLLAVVMSAALGHRLVLLEHGLDLVEVALDLLVADRGLALPHEVERVIVALGHHLQE